MIKSVLKIFGLIFLITTIFGSINLRADSHTPNMTFDFLPKFVHYQGEIKVNGKFKKVFSSRTNHSGYFISKSGIKNLEE